LPLNSARRRSRVAIPWFSVTARASTRPAFRAHHPVPCP